MQHLLFLLSLLLLSGLAGPAQSSALPNSPKAAIQNNKIKVLNFGSFHFGATSDANSVDFDENNANIQQEIRTIAKLIAQFKPSIICLEFLPEQDEQINQAYRAFLAKPENLDATYGELSMIGFDVARLSGVKKVYGIDNHMGYNYSLGDFIENSAELSNSVDPQTYLELTNEPFKHHPDIGDLDRRFAELSLNDKLKLLNDPIMLEHSLNTNADKLLYVAIEDGFQGAEQAAQFYLRNMKIFSNLNRIKMDHNDRVLILMGSAHTAMLREFIGRSPKFELVNTLDYLAP
tara:strand:- start:197 stop:1066 length:870 start_codon:yes stop_codon:yes gene_type:complete